MNPPLLSAQPGFYPTSTCQEHLPPPLTPQLKNPPWLPHAYPSRALPLCLAVEARLCSSLPQLFSSSSPLLVLSFPVIALSPSVCAHGLTCP